MNDNNDIKQTISELHRIQGLWDDFKRNEDEYEELKSEKKEAEHNVAIKWIDKAKDFDQKEKEKLPARPKTPSGWSNIAPTPVLLNWDKPIITIILTAVSRLLATFWFLPAIALMICGSLIGTILSFIPIIKIIGTLIGTLCMLLASGLFMFCFINIFYFSTDKNKENISLCLALNNYNKSNGAAEWETKFNSGITDEAIDAFYKDFQNYDTAFLAYTKKCEEKASEIVDKYAEEDRAVSLEYLEKMKEKLDINTPILEELQNQTFIHTDYVPYASRIANLLETGRADTLKEAINLMLDDMRKDREEEERREAAYRQEEETRRHNMAMQRVAEQEARDARAHNEAMERAARDQAAAAKAQAAAAQAAANDARRQAQQAESERRRQEYNARNDALRRCQGCINSAKCSHKGIVNCAAFRPR